ncbi:MAG: hypothetical protein AB7S48_02965 [Bacteroidales bacterium]
MKLDNETTIYGLHNVKLILAIFVVIYIVLMLITSLPDFIQRHTGITSGWAIVIVIGCYFLFFFYFILKGSAYFSYNDEGTKMIIRTFKTNPFGSPKISIEIPKNEFYKYDIVKKHLKEELILFVRKGNKISKYPPISIVSVTEEQKELLSKTLDNLSKVKDF